MARCEGANTDWCGVEGCLIAASEAGRGKPALIVGAGGAARAAIYALHERLACNPIYVVNRDKDEVAGLLRDTAAYGPGLSVKHLDCLEAVKKNIGEEAGPFYIVGAIPDYEPRSAPELETRDILVHFLQSTRQPGVLLDICYKPRRTRIIKLGDQYGWHVVDGTMAIGRQVYEQYRLWCGEATAKLIPLQEAWAVLQQAAEKSTAINL
ncbi:hypothetical protein PISL3812_00969 [Talaromyces islandicus]|uniref:Quinate/shikimate 5-dehydrogenase/glutamyl-tRNA reductase domain-containing protein n=1 Tax=Talaromyces islandicus TaxID=28573 RepID=A0A0U1LKZ3_TALIS|nr:hypothetical protein PISL3812_00969 [Talaromyces islandicus]